MNLLGQAKLADFYLKLYKGELGRIAGYEFAPQKAEFVPENGCEKYNLPRSSPEAQGVSSRHIDGFLKELAALRDANTHGVMLLRRGRVIAEAHFSPYNGEYPHMMYSMSKSVLSMAIGIAIQEGLFSLDEKLIDAFADKAAPLHSQRLNSLTVRHLLTMQSGIRFNELGSVLEREWAKSFMQSDFLFEPGTQFHYNSMNSYMLAALLCRKTGAGVLEYLTPRLFEPMGIRNVCWEKCPAGIEKGGWGLSLRLEDMAKLGQLYLQMGKWRVNGKPVQLVPKNWVEESTKNQLGSCEGTPNGYGYHIWMCAIPGAYDFNGVFGQYVLVVPKYDFVIAITAGNQNIFPGGSTLELIYRYFNRENVFGTAPLPKDKGAERELERTCGSLIFLQTQVMPRSAQPAGFFERLRRFFVKNQLPALPKPSQKHNGEEYVLEKSMGALLPLVLQGVHANFTGGLLQVKFTFSSGACKIIFTEEKNCSEVAAGMDGVPRYSRVSVNGEVYQTGGMARWTTDEDDRDVLKLFVSFIETPDTRIFKFIFMEDGTIQVKFDEVPSVRSSLTMLEGLIGGDSAVAVHVRGRLNRLLAPQAAGRLKSGDGDSVKD